MFLVFLSVSVGGRCSPFSCPALQVCDWRYKLCRPGGPGEEIKCTVPPLANQMLRWPCLQWRSRQWKKATAKWILWDFKTFKTLTRERLSTNTAKNCCVYDWVHVYVLTQHCQHFVFNTFMSHKMYVLLISTQRNNKYCSSNEWVGKCIYRLAWLLLLVACLFF